MRRLGQGHEYKICTSKAGQEFWVSGGRFRQPHLLAPCWTQAFCTAEISLASVKLVNQGPQQEPWGRVQLALLHSQPKLAHHLGRAASQPCASITLKINQEKRDLKITWGMCEELITIAAPGRALGARLSPWFHVLGSPAHLFQVGAGGRQGLRESRR